MCSTLFFLLRFVTPRLPENKRELNRLPQNTLPRVKRFKELNVGEFVC